ncbi:MAG TPA: Ppx/GppA family phosphatase [Acidimicrobiia bacterium]|nr:Ppx/GppA family phosphatase [Acidimicrobiia bacterium]
MSPSAGEGVVHRWEWRAFGSHFPYAERVFAGMTPEGEPSDTEETYLLGPGDVNVKIRFALLDVKKLMEVDENGLELWAPISKGEFPMSAEDALAVFDAWGLARPETERDVYELDQFLDELIDPHPELDIVTVLKHRVRYSIEGCMSELTTLSANGREAKTIAVETSDQSAVVAARDALGMSGHVNMSYNHGLRCLLGMSPVRYAVVDIGTNSVKFHIGEQHPDGSWSRVVDRAEVTRLGEGLDDSGEIQAEPMERTIRAVAGMVAEARDHEALAIAAVGTAALRIASNSGLVVDSMRERVGVPVEVVSGEEESRLAYLAVVSGVGVADGDVVVFDTGGGSTQFTFGRDGVIGERYSVNVGAVSYTERFGLDHKVDDHTIESAREALRQDFSSLDGRTTPGALVGMGGAMTNLTAVSLQLASYNPDAVQGAVVTAAEVERQISLYASMDLEDRRSIVGLQHNRAPVILAGALVVSTVMETLGQESVLVSDRGLRHGLIRERFGLF